MAVGKSTGLDSAIPYAPPPPRPLRADARRNRDQILAAALETFALEGHSVSLDEIARRAGVGPGTVHRHFPTKELLFEAVIITRIQRLTQKARALTGLADPVGVLFGFLFDVLEEGRAKKDLVDALIGAGVDVGEVTGPAALGLNEALGELLTRAQEAGVREDVTVADLMAVMASTLIAAQRTGDAQLPSRILAVYCDGLRGEGSLAAERWRQAGDGPARGE
ncbi:TetR/AcrR family transcriptional regulator [Streptomyces sp. NBC_00576]|uniref:TetR/AcrR family transcriptional regulator n=1 Tax=Streptomyces sp. NBC_00576 TaxID=2903665 RepID=UPI002E811923|nr:helix-turn-helix domain-containing protein [Streptomyces sp. NBC_00576]WUB70431.1 TetR/AcrR family transcriptional regulator [Streptomyces sp. NBC_00576]